VTHAVMLLSRDAAHAPMLIAVIRVNPSKSGRTASDGVEANANDCLLRVIKGER
jgi:hypothetical protein